MSQVTKLTTGITGLVVSKNPHHTLGILYNKIMRTLQNMPEGAAYRKHTESVIKERTAILKSTTDVASIEKKIGCGQIEEVIMQAENELILARKMMAWKPWEPLVKEAPPNQWSWPPVQSSS